MSQATLAGQTAIVTGSGRGIGRAIALELADYGANVVVTARTREEIEATAETIQEDTPGTATSVQGDISNSEHVDQLFDATIAEFGGLDILVNNAGMTYGFDPLTDSLADIHDVMEVNLFGAADCSLHAARKFEAAGGDTDAITGDAGRILNISSLSAHLGAQMHYGMAKAGMEAMTRALAVTLAPHDVLVNAIAPGWVATTASARDSDTSVKDYVENDDFRENYFEEPFRSVPLARMAQPEEIARTARFLVSPENTYITGQTIVMDGGLSISPR